MTECNLCDGTGWVLVQGPEVSSVKPCPCRTNKPAEARTPLTIEAAAYSTGIICELLDFAPESDEARAVLTDGLLSMCETLEQVRYLIRRLPHFHTKWGTCGLRGMRQILCQKIHAKGWLDHFRDGVVSGWASARDPTVGAGRKSSAGWPWSFREREG